MKIIFYFQRLVSFKFDIFFFYTTRKYHFIIYFNRGKVVNFSQIQGIRMAYVGGLKEMLIKY